MKSGIYVLRDKIGCGNLIFFAAGMAKKTPFLLQKGDDAVSKMGSRLTKTFEFSGQESASAVRDVHLPIRFPSVEGAEKACAFPKRFLWANVIRFPGRCCAISGIC